MAMNGKRVGLLDFDLISPTLGMIFEDSLKGGTLTDALLEQDFNLNTIFELEDVTKGIIGKGSLYVIPSKHDVLSIAKVLRDGYPIIRVKKVLEYLEQHLKLDYLMIDTHSGLAEDTIFALSVSNLIFVVFKPDIQGLASMKAILNLFSKFKLQTMTIINMATNSDVEKNIIEEMEHYCGIPIVEEIPFYPDIFQNKDKKLLAFWQPNHEFIQHLKNITKMVEVMEIV